MKKSGLTRRSKKIRREYVKLIQIDHKAGRVDFFDELYDDRSFLILN